MARTTANFRALRELCGITQQQAADDLGVRVRTVKRWESGEVPAPDDAVRYIADAAADHTRAVRERVGEIAARADPGADEVCLQYYRTQAQADLAGDTDPYQFSNAVTRSIAERLEAMGYRVSFSYPDEERIYDREV